MGVLRGFPLIVPCLGWCPIMTPVKRQFSFLPQLVGDCKLLTPSLTKFDGVDSCKTKLHIDWMYPSQDAIVA